MRLSIALRTYAVFGYVIGIESAKLSQHVVRDLSLPQAIHRTSAEASIEAVETIAGPQIALDSLGLLEMEAATEAEAEDPDKETSGYILMPWFVTTLVPQTNKSRTTGRGKNKKTFPPPAYLCQQYPDYFSTLNAALDSKLPVNVTCWTSASAADKRSACDDNGAAWFREAAGCWIPDYIINTQVKVSGSPKRNGIEELTDVLRYCPPPQHQLASVRQRYREGTYCYEQPTLTANAFPLGPANGSVELDCWTTGDLVHGDEVWWKWKNANCLIPNQIFDPFSFYGSSSQCQF